MNVKVDTEALAWGLEKGIGQSDTFFSSLPREIRLRHTACGLVSAAIHSYAHDEGLRSRLLIASPKIPFDQSLQHVVALIESDPQNPTVIDASPSQFLGYAGVTTALESRMGEVLYPPEKILTFGLQDMQYAVSWLTKAVRTMREKHPHIDYGDSHIIPGPLEDAAIEDVQATFEAIYTPDRYYTWMPPHHVMVEGDRVAAAIPPGAILIED